MEDESSMSICTWVNCPGGTETAHVLSKGQGSLGRQGDSSYCQLGRYSGWDSAESVGGCGVFYYSWDSFEEIEDYGERSVSSVYVYCLVYIIYICIVCVDEYNS